MFRAYDAQRERLVAVKVFNLDLPPDQGHRLVAELERLVAADLTHPSMAAPLATGITGVSAFLAQDYVAAESLDLAIRQYGPASPADALRIAAQIAGALDFAAVADITHGALHPRDVLTSTDETRLTGVGVQRALEQIGVAAPVRRPYTAPERMAGGGWDRRADVFSLAALMHEVLWARRVSATGAQAAEGLTEVAGADLAALRAAFARGLADDPAERFDTALEFAEALKAAFPTVTLTAPVGPKRRPQREAAPKLPLDESLPEPPPFIATPAAEPPPGPARDLDLASIDVEVRRAAAPAIVDLDQQLAVAPALAFDAPEPPANVPAGLMIGRAGESVSKLDRSRAAVWPLGLALGIGLALGFAGGYGFGVRERSTANAAPAPAGREFTERAIAEPTKVEQPPVRLPPETTEKKPEIAPPPSAPAPKTAENRSVGPGRLLIRSTPAGALVTVDGRESGKTPLTVRDLSRGVHRVQLTHDGFTPAERRVTLTRARPTQSMTVALDPARAAATNPGTLRVESRPAGAKVYVDGTMIGTTPLTQSVTSGEHSVRLELTGYRQWNSSVRVAASETSRVTASLER